MFASGAGRTTAREPRLIVASSAAALEACVARLERAGVAVRRRWEAGDVVCAGSVRTRADAEAALLAALRGAGIVALLPEDPTLSASFFEDLRRLGPVDVAGEPDVDPLERLAPEQRRLLELLAEGLSVAAAARRLYVSRRTAVRRLASARAVLGVRSTAEAVVFARAAARGK
jgi:DNA-binding NarL/FixJ family response regulator